MEGESGGEVEGRIRFPLTLDLDKFPIRGPSPRLHSITTLGYLIFLVYTLQLGYIEAGLFYLLTRDLPIFHHTRAQG